MVLTKRSKVWRLLSGLRPGLAGLVDTGRDGLESYVDVVGRAIRQEAWMKTEKKVIPSTDKESNETTRANQFQVHRNQHSGGKLGFQPKKPNNQDKSSRSSGRCQMGGKRKNGPRNQGQMGQSGGHKQA